MPKRKPKRGVALSGTWAYRGKPPVIGFRITPGDKGLNVKLSLPRKDMTLPEPVWRGFFRFLALTCHTIRPATVDEKVKQFLLNEREKRRGRWRRRVRRHRINRGVVKTGRKPKAPPTVDLTQPTNPSGDLIAVAEEALKNKKGNKP